MSRSAYPWGFWAAAALAVIALLSGPTAEAESEAQARISSPTEEQILHGTVVIQVEAASSAGISQVMLSRDDSFLDSDSSAPYQIRWDTRSVTDGPHTLLARVQSLSGRWVASSEPRNVVIDNTPPKIRIIHPSAQELILGKIALQAEASDNLKVAEVRYYVEKIMVGAATSTPYTVDWDPRMLSNGIHLIRAEAVDEAGNKTASPQIEVKISNPNKAPSLLPMANLREVNEGKQLSFSVVGYDPDGLRDPLTYKVENLPAWATFDTATGEFIGTPDFNVASLKKPERDYEVQFRVCDPEPLCSEPQKVSIHVFNVNRPPVIETPKDIDIFEGTPLSLTLKPAVDPDGDKLTYQIGQLPPWLSFNPDTLTFTGTPDFTIATNANPKVTYPNIEVLVYDPEPLSTMIRFGITVENTDRPPVLETIGPKTTAEGNTLQFDVKATDPDHDPIRLSANPLPPGASFVDKGNGTGSFEWKTRVDMSGRYGVIFTAAESEGTLTDQETVVITLREVSLAVSGTIQDPSGTPAADTKVQLEKIGQTVKTTTTDKQGFYLFNDVAPGTYLVRPVAENIGTQFSSRGRPAETTHFDPMNQTVAVVNSDQRGVDFTSVPAG